MSRLSRLFGDRGPATVERATTKPAAEVEYRGFTVRAEPYREGSQFQTAGTILKTVNGEELAYRFVRADRFGTVEDAAQFAITKGKQIVDEQGERILARRATPASSEPDRHG